MSASTASLPPIADLVENFAFLDQWDDRYRYVIELGRMLPEMPEALRTDETKVQGCASQVWLFTHVSETPEGPVLSFEGDSDAHIVRGLVAILLARFSGVPAREILKTDALAFFAQLGLKEHLTPQRSNGLRSMVERIRRDSETALACYA